MNEGPSRSDSYLLSTTAPLSTAFDAWLLDLDGVVYRGPLAVAHAVDTIVAARAVGVSVVFVTNNANRLPETVADQLVALGVPAAGADVMTSALAAAAMLERELPAGAKVLAVGGPGLRSALTDVGFELVDRADAQPVAVVQGFAPTVGWADLAEAGYAISAGARFVATNLDLTIPTERGVAPGNGSLVDVVARTTGTRPASAGKPEPEIFRQAARRAGASRPLMVGDRLDTDLAGAAAAGIPGILVLTGVDDARSAVLARADERPRLLARDMRDLLDQHPGADRQPDGSWRCREAVVSVDGGDIRIDGSAGRGAAGAAGSMEITVDAWRALCCAAWEAADLGRPLTGVPNLRVLDDRATPPR